MPKNQARSLAPRNKTKTPALPAQSLGEQAYVGIKRMILTHELRAGDQINVARLSEQLNLGRSPIHLAIHRLDREGLVDILPRKGIMVKAETLESFLELIAARLLVEPYLTSLATEHATDELLNNLEHLVATGWEHDRRQNRLGGMEIDRLFHQTLYESSGNRILADFAGHLLDRSMRLWFRPASGISERPNVAELEALLNTIRKGDKAAASKMMEDHIGSVRQKFLA